MLTYPPPSTGRDREGELLSEVVFIAVSQRLRLFGKTELCNSWYYWFTKRTLYSKLNQHGNYVQWWKSHLTLFQIYIGAACWISVVQLFGSFMYNSPLNILQVPLWFRWQPLMQMILLMATVLEWFTAYCKDNPTFLWSPKQVIFHKLSAVMLRKKKKMCIKTCQELINVVCWLTEYIWILLISNLFFFRVAYENLTSELCDKQKLLEWEFLYYCQSTAFQVCCLLLYFWLMKISRCFEQVFLQMFVSEISKCHIDRFPEK